MDRPAIIDAIKASPLSLGFRAEIVDALAQIARTMEYESDQLVVQAGDDCDGLYIVVSGQANVENTFAGSKKVVAALKAGDFFGEVGLLGGGKRGSSVVAASGLSCLMFPVQPIRELAATYPELRDRLENTGNKRTTTNLQLHLGELPDEE
ncbi:MAG: cyclic nucleotide-binding domain-containing protein [Deltaproteobacteria bacterium]|nr:cyclic nucleotide-binding domain-containing protein [Deltaproteobacteria bacterium]